MNRTPIPQPISEQRLIAVMRRLGAEHVHAVTPILVDAGVSVFEVTMDGEEALQSIEWLAGRGYLVGAGTVRTAGDAAAAMRAGASFASSPGLDQTVLGTAATLGLPMIPGALTPSEIMAAWSAGSGAVKLFPASLGGHEYLRALRGPLADIPLIPTGGVTSDNAASYLESGATAVAVGRWLTGHTDMYQIAQRATALVDSISHLR
ncbi:MAG: bifunctional 4-hydroxy-2-oxoglutarate aldolase/2-dehydro-3-deoxy-phosphogluconate aldolase [Acidimicrobiia bacterium]|nr:bifunctional 4-hydroxy-2-oxoglutarate aldolase/2-dehydro-3-deoxy-phosphogluconate aldolase [Acidimicrobiia bacterium]